MRLRKDAVARRKLLQSVLPVCKSLSSGLLELSSWLDEADGILASHFIGGQPEAVIERINKHKVCRLFAVISNDVFFCAVCWFALYLLWFLLPRLFSYLPVAGLAS